MHFFTFTRITHNSKDNELLTLHVHFLYSLYTEVRTQDRIYNKFRSPSLILRFYPSVLLVFQSIYLKNKRFI